jgi:hypothetical protein
MHGSANKPPRPRFRSKGGFSSIAGGNITVDGTCSSGTVNTAYGSVARNGEFTETWDLVTPNFFKRSARGEIISNPFRKRTTFLTSSGDFFQIRYTVPSCSSPVKNATVDFYGPQALGRLHDDFAFEPTVDSLVSDSDIKSATIVAATKAWEKSNAHDADILIDVAEFSKTLRMLRDPIQLSSAFLKKIQLGKRGIKTLDVNDAVAYANGLWLQYRYGIRPLVSTVNGVVKALLRTYAPKRQTYRGKDNSLKSVSQSTGTCSVGTVVPFDYAVTQTDEVSIRTGLLLEDDVVFTQALGIDASGMLALPWELVPFSFVADWFVNVGDFLGALAPFLTRTPLSSWTTTKRTQSYTFSVIGNATPNPAVMTLLRTPVENRSKIVEETIRQPGLLIPSLTWKPRALTSVYNDLRVVDSFALLHQQFLKAFRP